MEKNYLDLSGLKIYDSELKKYVKSLIDDSIADTIIQADSFLKFPTVGKENALYVDTETSVLYRWSDEEVKYYKIGQDYNDIELIDANF